MPFLIDSDWIIDRSNDDPAAIELIEQLAPEGVAMSIVTYMEALDGVLRSSMPAAAELKFEGLVAVVPILPLSKAVAKRCAELRAGLRSQGKRVNQRALDLIIAATAIEHDLTLVTRNVRDFADIPGLRLRSS